MSRAAHPMVSAPHLARIANRPCSQGSYATDGGLGDRPASGAARQARIVPSMGAEQGLAGPIGYIRSAEPVKLPLTPQPLRMSCI